MTYRPERLSDDTSGWGVLFAVLAGAVAVDMLREAVWRWIGG